MLPESITDTLLFYLPFLLIGAGLAVAKFSRKLAAVEIYQIAVILAVAWAAAMEAFPRFAREQVVASMPFVTLLLFYLLYQLRPAIESVAGLKQSRWALAAVPVVFLIIAGRLLAGVYLEDGFRLRSSTLLTVERARGVCFPRDKAQEIEAVVDYIQLRVPENGYFFAQSYAGSSFLFLADRRNPSGAQFWGGVGVSEAEKARTLQALTDESVRLIVTSDRDLAAERYTPMREFLLGNFYSARRFGETLILERRNGASAAR
jgi:hypothetical protein